MPRLVVLCLLPALAMLFPSAVRGQERDLEQALALQNVMEKVIAQAEPAIACILVSRSAGYSRLGGPSPLAGQPAASGPSGQLGDFDPARPDLLGKEKSKEERRKLDLADPDHIPEAFGSGVVIDTQGLILTNYHVIRDATKIFVRLPGARAGYADIHAADPRSDLAILRIRSQSSLPWKAIAIGDAAKVQRGQFVLTLANPFAVGFRDGQPSASWGIISNLRRRIPGQPREEERTKPLHYYGTLLQTDTRLHLGCSGGALLNLGSELIGLTTALAAIHGGDTPGGFAIPLDAGTRRILDVLKRGEEVEYGFLGVALNEPRLGLGRGGEVVRVYKGSPADRDGHLRPDDVILAVDGALIHESEDLFLHLGTQLAGAKVKLKILQRGTKSIQTVDVTLGKFYVTGKQIASSLGRRPFTRGLRVDDTTLLVQQPPRLSYVPAGVLVSDVQPETAAAQAHLKPGEVITHVNKRPVFSPANFYQAVAGVQGPIELQLFSFGSHEAPAKVILK